MFKARRQVLADHLQLHGIDIALICDDDSVYYYTGYYDYLHMDFGRPTLFMVTREGQGILITPSMELDMAQAAADVDQIEPWNDGVGEEWRTTLPAKLSNKAVLAMEHERTPPIVTQYVQSLVDARNIRNLTPLIEEMRMIKSDDELQLARHAGQVAMAMMLAARETIGDGVPEYEVALSTSRAGTLAAAALLTQHYADARMSPNTHFLQIMASGQDIIMPHHRATTRVMKFGDPVFCCFCGMTNFHRFKLGFDRTFWIGEVTDKSQEAVYDVTVKSQAAALAEVKAGVAAEEVHAAYAEVIQSAGYEFPFRCGRATGFSFLEKPQLVAGDKTRLAPGMVLAVDGCVCVPGVFRAQVGDSIIVTESGYELLTEHPKDLGSVVLNETTYQ